MSEPLALVLYEKLLPGSQLVNRLQDLKYRVQTISDPAKLTESAETNKPIIVLADLEPTSGAVCDAIRKLKANGATAHLPVVAFAGDGVAEGQTAARDAGAALVVGETALLGHLEQLLDQALHVE